MTPVHLVRSALVLAIAAVTLLSADAAAAIDGARNGPVSSAALWAARGERIGFSVRAGDSDGKLSGIEWYLDGRFLGAQYVADVGGTGAAALFWRGINFPELGVYTVEGVPFDRSGHFGEPVRWQISVRERPRLLYVDHTETRLDDPAGIAALRAQVVAAGANQVALYRLHTILPEAGRTARLRELIRQLHANGVARVFAVVGGLADVARVGGYLAASASPGDRFDGVLSEFEFWNPDMPFADYLGLLSAMRDLASQHTLLVATYLGWFDAREAAAITARVDLVLLHAYRSTPAIAYDYLVERLELLAGASDHPVEVWPIFSAECDFMGGWLGGQASSGADPLETAEQTLLGDFRGDLRTMRNGIRMAGFAWFTAARLADALAGGCR